MGWPQQQHPLGSKGLTGRMHLRVPIGLAMAAEEVTTLAARLTRSSLVAPAKLNDVARFLQKRLTSVGSTQSQRLAARTRSLRLLEVV